MTLLNKFNPLNFPFNTAFIAALAHRAFIPISLQDKPFKPLGRAHILKCNGYKTAIAPNQYIKKILGNTEELKWAFRIDRRDERSHPTRKE